MESRAIALHLYCANRDVSARIDAWLSEHQFQIINASNAYDACARVVSAHAVRPALALLCGDGLDDSERAILHYIRRAAPHVVLIVYGDDADWVIDQSCGKVTDCREPGALCEFLENPPPELSRTERNPIGDAPHASKPRESAPPVASSSEPSRDAASPGFATPQARALDPDPRGVLTREEIAVLFGDE